MFLTAAATAHLTAIREVGAAIQPDVLRDLDKQEAAAVLVALGKMRRNLLSCRNR